MGCCGLRGRRSGGSKGFRARDVVRSVTISFTPSPIGRCFTSAIRVYEGDVFAAHRSGWEPAGLTEQKYESGKEYASAGGGLRSRHASLRLAICGATGAPDAISLQGIRVRSRSVTRLQVSNASAV